MAAPPCRRPQAVGCRLQADIEVRLRSSMRCKSLTYHVDGTVLNNDINHLSTYNIALVVEPVTPSKVYFDLYIYRIQPTSD